MKVGVVKETLPGERRVALVPDTVSKLVAAKLDVVVWAPERVASYIATRSPSGWTRRP